jgi:hypothetical protein
MQCIIIRAAKKKLEAGGTPSQPSSLSSPTKETYRIAGRSAPFTIDEAILSIVSASFLGRGRGGGGGAPDPYMGPAPPGFFAVHKADSGTLWYGDDPESAFSVAFADGHPTSCVFRIVVKLSGMSEAEMDAALVSQATPTLSIGYEKYSLADRCTSLTKYGASYLNFTLEYVIVWPLCSMPTDFAVLPFSD